MLLFNNATIATSFKASANPDPKEANNVGNNKKNQNGIGTCKTELVNKIFRQAQLCYVWYS
jgi:hypothetical protein